MMIVTSGRHLDASLTTRGEDRVDRRLTARSAAAFLTLPESFRLPCAARVTFEHARCLPNYRVHYRTSSSRHSRLAEHRRLPTHLDEKKRVKDPRYYSVPDGAGRARRHAKGRATRHPFTSSRKRRGPSQAEPG